MTVEFAPAAAAQARSLGFEPALCLVPHPIQNRTAEELERIADETVERILELICDTPFGRSKSDTSAS